jgi:microcompartment protein CcmL/EutN
MAKAIGMIEYVTVSLGVTACDTMVKTADVDIIEAQVVCPGNYIAIISCELSAVRAAVDAATAKCPAKVVDTFVLGNPHEDIFPAIYGANEIDNPKALGILETYSAASIIRAADNAAKTADVKLVELRIAKGMCGKSYMYLTGEIAAVEAAIERAKAGEQDSAMFLDSSVIANPDKKLWKNIL